jgi:hypothetical protein
LINFLQQQLSHEKAKVEQAKGDALQEEELQKESKKLNAEL